MKFKDIIFYNKGKGPSDGNNYWRRYTVPHYIYIGLMLLIMGICIGLTSLFVCSYYLGIGDMAMFLSYLHSPLLLLLNILPCVLLLAALYFATGRSWIAFLATAVIIFLLSVINYWQIRIRNEPFTVSELSLAGEAVGIVSNYTLEFTGRVVFAIAALIFGTLFAVFLMRGSLPGAVLRIVGSVASLAVLVILICTVYQSDSVYSKAVNNTADINIWSDLQVYVSKGFIYPFLHTAQDAFESPPDGYNKDEAAEILASYSDEDIPDDKKVNLIVVQLETYCDLSLFSTVPVYDSVYAPLHALQEECLSGSIVANVFAGGTVDTERNFLTGYTVSEDYSRVTNSFVYYLRSQGYYTEGYHAGDNWFYNRENVEEYLGMDNYYFLQDYDTTDRSDRLFFSILSDLYDSRDESVPYFNFSITYQNHGAYSTDWTYDESFLSSEGLSEESYNILNNYLYGIADTTQRMYDFIDSFRDNEEPVVIVFYGDHMPWLGDGNSVYNELGINIDLSTEEGFYNYYSTPLIIWANDSAKEVTGGSFTGDCGNLSSCFLMSRIFEECGWTGSAFMQMNRELYETISIVHSNVGLYCVDGVLTKDLEGDVLNMMTRYRYVEYYMKHNWLYGG